MGLHRSPGRGSRGPGSLVPGVAAASWERAETAHPQATASGRQDVRTSGRRQEPETCVLASPRGIPLQAPPVT